MDGEVEEGGKNRHDIWHIHSNGIRKDERDVDKQ